MVPLFPAEQRGRRRMPNAKQNPSGMPDGPISGQPLVRVLMWVCLIATIPVAVLGIPHKFDEPWGTMLAGLLLGALLCGVLRFVLSRKATRGHDGAKQDGGFGPRL